MPSTSNQKQSRKSRYKSRYKSDAEKIIYASTGSLKFVTAVAKHQFMFFEELQTCFKSIDDIQITNENIQQYHNIVISVFKMYRVNRRWPDRLVDNNVKHHNMQSYKMKLMVELLWRLHMMNPSKYYNDCMKSFGIIIPFILDKTQANQSFSRNINTSQCKLNVAANVTFGTSINLIDAFENHKLFIKKMVRTYENLTGVIQDGAMNVCLDLCLQRYCKFLNLQKILTTKRNEEYKKLNELVLIPRSDMQLLLHSHQTVPVHYHISSMSLFGTASFDPDSSELDDASFMRCTEQTTHLWNRIYKDPKYKYYSYDSDSWGVYLLILHKNANEHAAMVEEAKQQQISIDIAEPDDVITKLQKRGGILCFLLCVFLILGSIGTAGYMYLGHLYQIDTFDTFIYINNNNFDVTIETRMKYSINSHLRRVGYKAIGLKNYNVQNINYQLYKESKMTINGPKEQSGDSTYSYIDYQYNSDFDFFLPYVYSFGVSYSMSNDPNNKFTCTSNSEFSNEVNTTLQTVSVFLPWLNKFEENTQPVSSNLRVFCHKQMYQSNNGTSLTIASNENSVGRSTTVTDVSTSSDYALCYERGNIVQSLGSDKNLEFTVANVGESNVGVCSDEFFADYGSTSFEIYQDYGFWWITAPSVLFLCCLCVGVDNKRRCKCKICCCRKKSSR